MTKESKRKKHKGRQYPPQEILQDDYACIAFYSAWAANHFDTPDHYDDRLQMAYLGLLKEFRRQQKGEKKQVAWKCWWWWTQVARNVVLWDFAYKRDVFECYDSEVHDKAVHQEIELQEEIPDKFLQILPKHLLPVVKDVIQKCSFTRIATKRKLKPSSVQQYAWELRRRFEALYAFEDLVPACKQG